MFKTFALLAVFGVIATSTADVLTDAGLLSSGLVQIVPAQQILIAQQPQIISPAIVSVPSVLPVTGKSIGLSIGGGIGIDAGKRLVNGLPGVGIGLNAGLGLGAGKTVYGPGGIVLRRPGLGLGVGVRAGLGIGVGRTGWGSGLLG